MTTLVRIQECERTLLDIPFAGTCSVCGGAARWWPTLRRWTHTWDHQEKSCLGIEAQFVPIDGF